MLEFEPINQFAKARNKVFKVILGFGLVGALVALGSTLAANINLNNNQAVEFGQGMVQATACDNQITVTPFSTFVNQSNETFQLLILDAGPDAFRVTDVSKLRVGMKFNSPSLGLNNVITVINPPVADYYTIEYTGGTFSQPTEEIATFQGGGFYLEKILLSGVDVTDQIQESPNGCQGKKFKIKVLDSAGSTLNQYYINVNEDDFSSLSGEITYSDLSNPEESSVELSINNFMVESNDVYRITIESSNKSDGQVALACNANCVFIKNLGEIRIGSVVSTSLFSNGLTVLEIEPHTLSSESIESYLYFGCGLPDNASGSWNLEPFPSPCPSFNVGDSGFTLQLSGDPFYYPQEMILEVRSI